MEAFQNIIFDLGGVLFDIDYKLTEQAFRELGLNDFDKLFTQMRQDRLFDDFEKGLITAGEFREQIRMHTQKDLSDLEIDNAWNAILIGLPKKNIELLMRLKKKFRLFLLSNTNEIHEQAFIKMIIGQYDEYILEHYFEKIYLSHRIHMRKPDIEIFKKVISDNNLDPRTTLFIDDSPQHVEGAIKAGLQAIHLKKPETIIGLFDRI